MYQEGLILLQQEEQMPYKLKKTKKDYKVMTKSGPHKGRTHSKKGLPLDKALAQMRAMYAHLSKGEK